MSYKITQAEIDANNVKSVVGNTLTGTVTQNKNVFDKLIEFLCGKFNTFVDYVEANMLTSSIVGNLIDLDTTYKENTVGAINEVLGDVGDVSTLTTSYKTDTVGAINEVNGKLNKYLVATASSNGDFSLTISGTLSTNNIVCIKFPSATDNTKDARLSLDGGTTYKNIKYCGDQIIALLIENEYVEFAYNGIDFQLMTKPHIESTTAYISAPDITVNEINIILDGQDIWINGILTTSVDITDAQKTLFTLDLDDLGVSDLIISRVAPMFSDGGNAFIMGTIGSTGIVYSNDVSSTVVSGSTIVFTASAKVNTWAYS